jgi:hypothetical protein
VAFLATFLVLFLAAFLATAMSAYSSVQGRGRITRALLSGAVY